MYLVYSDIFVQYDSFAKRSNIVSMQSKNAQEVETKTSDHICSFSETLRSITSNSNRVFIDFAQEDSDIFVNTEGDSPQTIENLELYCVENHKNVPEQLDKELDNYDSVIILYARAPLDWLKQRLNLYISIQVKHRDRFSIYVMSPHEELYISKSTALRINWKHYSSEIGRRV